MITEYLAGAESFFTGGVTFEEEEEATVGVVLAVGCWGCFSLIASGVVLGGTEEVSGGEVEGGVLEVFGVTF